MPAKDPIFTADLVEGTGFDSLYGLKIDSITADEVVAHVAVQDHHKQPAGLVHGGVYASIAESIASRGTWAAQPDGTVALGMSNQTSFLRSISEGRIHATARAIAKGKTTWVWEVEIKDDQDQLCAVSRMTIAVRQLRKQ
jgi:uncharacterized protein (TIGR00369 family)